MRKQRYTYTVNIDRDQVPGWNHQPEDFKRALEKWLNESIPHYNPTVEFVECPEGYSPAQCLYECGSNRHNNELEPHCDLCDSSIGPCDDAELADAQRVMEQDWVPGTGVLRIDQESLDEIDVNDCYVEYCGVIGVDPAKQTRQHFLGWLSKQEFPAAIREMRRWDAKYNDLEN